jgi:hypothetical protein
LREEHRLRVFENRVLRRIFGPKRGEDGSWGKLRNDELHSLSGKFGYSLVPYLNLGLGVGYPNNFSSVSSVHTKKCWYRTLKKVTTFSYQILQYS